MVRFLLVSVTGWLAVLGVGIEVALPYMIRNAAAVVTRGSPPLRLLSLRVRLWPHYWLGYALVALVLTHTSFAGPAMGRSDATGIWAATLALGLLLLQVGLGLILKAGGGKLRQVRRWHFWSMIGLVGLLLTHLLRNG